MDIFNTMNKIDEIKEMIEKAKFAQNNNLFTTEIKGTIWNKYGDIWQADMRINQACCHCNNKSGVVQIHSLEYPGSLKTEVTHFACFLSFCKEKGWI